MGTGHVEERYGRTTPRRSVVVALAAALCLLAVGWAAWAAWSGRNQVHWQDVAFDVSANAHAGLTFDVTLRPGTTTVCTVHALNRAFAEVGRMDVPVGPSTARTVRRSVVIATSEQAVTAVVKRCSGG